MLNQVILETDVVRNDGLKVSARGNSYLSMTLLFKTAEKSDKGWGEKKHYIRSTLWGKSAESLAEKIKPGKHLIVRGKLIQNNWKTDKGEYRVSYCLTLEDIHFPIFKRRKIPNY